MAGSFLTAPSKDADSLRESKKLLDGQPSYRCNLCKSDCCEHVVKFTEERQSERGAGLKFDGGKGRWTLMMQGCASALAGVVNVLGFGAKKYAAHSWKQVENGEERYRDALYRHLHAIERGEEIDPESGLPHWDHLCCNAMFLSQKYHDSKE